MIKQLIITLVNLIVKANMLQLFSKDFYLI